MLRRICLILNNAFYEQLCKNTRLIFARNLRTIPASDEAQSLKLRTIICSLCSVQKATTVAQFANSFYLMLIHVQLQFPAALAQANTSCTGSLFNELK